MKGFVTRRNWGGESHCVVVVYFCHFYQTFRYRMSQVPSARENEWLGQIEHYKIYKSVFSQRNIFLNLTSISGICKTAKAKAFHMRRPFPFPKMFFASPNVSRHINILQKNLKTASRSRLRTSPSSRQSSSCKFKCILTFTLLISFLFFRLLIMRHVKNLAEDICKNSFIFIEEENKCDKCANRFRIKWR